MSAEPQVLLEADYCYPLDYGRPGEHAAAKLAEKTKLSIFNLTSVMECLWSFYEAMRLGKPLPNGDEKLAQLGTAMRTVHWTD